jgi:hypothetical protein
MRLLNSNKLQVSSATWDAETKTIVVMVEGRQIGKTQLCTRQVSEDPEVLKFTTKELIGFDLSCSMGTTFDFSCHICKKGMCDDKSACFKEALDREALDKSL